MKGRPGAKPPTSIQARRGMTLPATTIRLLWLQPSATEGLLESSLRERLSAQSLAIYSMVQEQLPGEAFRHFDLILLRVTDQTYGQVRETIHQIRACNRAPILLLTDQQTYEWSLVALPAGADAVVLADAPTEIIIARCLALLRRWLAST
jgi:DNA-binding response OmpR family regulator